ncbi:hypothetical protein I5R65_07255 [Herbaspirillum sp. AP02]|uniref:hypothetical protein n=1 Tax=unclassified Herbaspirillum TaxID=2624150 RepID=UPI0015DAB9D4|nr:MULTISPECIES: hypothetical protein [unclassified Herbaspirillum]MBG7619258.1 hypothetical protein [Herbaspirillum sp. AP02]NZD66542.1 hypothetical protein [Herbaspirillum sp. AP21]
MIGLLFIVVFVVWLVSAFYFGRAIPRWLGLKPAWSFLFVPLAFIAPIADELIGRWQFKRLCEKEAVVWLNPNWKSVKTVRNVSPELFSQVPGTAIPIEIQPVTYIDAETGQPFMNYNAVHTSGGLLLGKLGFGLGGTTTCWPKDELEIRKKINMKNLLNKEKSQ